MSQRVGLRRVVAFSTGSFLDMSASGGLETPRCWDNPPSDPCTTTKRAAYVAVHDRVAHGLDASRVKTI